MKATLGKATCRNGLAVIFLGLCCWTASTSHLYAAKPQSSVANFEERLKPKMEAFENTHEKAKKAMLKEFDKAINSVKKSRGTAQEKIAKIEEIEGMKSEFESEGTLPTSDDAIGLSIAYCEAIFDATIPLREFFEKELQKALSDAALRNRIQAEYDSWLSDIPGADELSNTAKWHGRRVFQKKGNAVDFHIHVDTCEGDAFSGSIWQDPSNVNNKVGLAYEGKFVGNRVHLVTTKILHGSPRQLELIGYVIERRLYLSVTAINGKRASDFVSVRKE